MILMDEQTQTGDDDSLDLGMPGYRASRHTPEKVELFLRIIRHQLDYCGRATRKAREKYNRDPALYAYFDLTAGPGFHRELGKQIPARIQTTFVDGFAAHGWGEQPQLKQFFWEREKPQVELLKKHVRPLYFLNQPHEIFHADHREEGEAGLLSVVRSLAQERRCLTGLMFYDPSPDAADMEATYSVVGEAFAPGGVPAKSMRYVDVLFHLPSVAIKRVMNWPVTADRYRIDLPTLTSTVGKKNWFLTEPYSGNKSGFFFLLGTNGNLGSEADLGFHRRESKKGRLMWERVTMTEEQRKRNLPAVQTSLF